MSNSSMSSTAMNTTPVHTEATETNDNLVALFITCISLVSVAAIPPNLLLLFLCTQPGAAGRGRKRTSLPLGSCRYSNLPLLLLSQLVSNLLITLSAPLDVLFLAGAGRDDVECVVFLALKSVLMLFSVLVGCLQGMDKVYRVRHLHNVFLKTRARWKLMAIAGSVLLSAVPLTLEVALTGGRPLKDGCQVLPVVVDVTEAIFLLAFTLSSLSLVAVVVMLRRHRRQVAVDEGETIVIISPSPKALPSPRLPSVSEVFNECTENQTRTSGTEPTGPPATSAAGGQKDNASQTQHKPLAVTRIFRSLSNVESKRANIITPAISLQRSPTLRQISVSSLPGTSGQHLSPMDGQCFFQFRDHGAQGNVPSTSATQIAGSSEEVRRSSKGSVRWSLSRQPSEGPGRLGVPTASAVRTRTPSTSSAAQRRLEVAAVKAVKRGALSLVLFLLCYMPLMVAILVLSLDQPVYETALLLEGLTLPISYVHALVSPVLAMRVDPEWRAHALVLFRRWFPCCRKARIR